MIGRIISITPLKSEIITNESQAYSTSKIFIAYFINTPGIPATFVTIYFSIKKWKILCLFCHWLFLRYQKGQSAE